MFKSFTKITVASKKINHYTRAPMKTQFCPSCRQSKEANPDNFQRRGDKWRNPCKQCISKRREIERKQDWTKAGFIKKPLVNKEFPNDNSNVNKDTNSSVSNHSLKDANKVNIKEINNDLDEYCKGSKLEEETGKVVPDLNFIFQEISNRYGAHFTLSVAKDGKARLHVQSSPARVWKGTVKEVIDGATKDSSP